jgi:dolichyldiphosphatase
VLSLFPYFVFFGHASVVLIRRDFSGLFLWIGYLVNEVINHFLKNAIKEPRPMVDFDHKIITYGNPSDHSQFMFYFASISCWMLFHRTKFDRWFWKWLYAAMVVGLALTVAVSRYYLSYHTVKQIVNGCLIGSVIGSGWYYLLTLVTPLFASLETMAPFSWFYFKDTSHVDDILQFEYDVYRSQRSKAGAERNNKKSK